jgi:hypothetical protein
VFIATAAGTLNNSKQTQSLKVAGQLHCMWHLNIYGVQKTIRPQSAACSMVCPAQLLFNIPAANSAGPAEQLFCPLLQLLLRCFDGSAAAVRWR